MTDKRCLGYTLFSVPSPRARSEQCTTIIDMNGTIIHEWEYTGFPSKVLPGGSLLCSLSSRGMLFQETDVFGQVSWEGDVEWCYEGWDDAGTEVMMSRQHHDYQREGNPVGYYAPNQTVVVNGSTLILAHFDRVVREISFRELRDDVIYEVDFEGNFTGFFWNASDHFDEFGFSSFQKIGIFLFPGTNIFHIRPRWGDWLHINSISRLGPNSWYQLGDTRFHPDNIIFDSREANIIGIIDHVTGKIVWTVGPSYQLNSYGRKFGQIIGPHHAHMIPEGLPGAGNILVFDNGGTAGYGVFGMTRYRRFYSRVIEFDPITYDMVWEYRKFGFYSPLVGSAQRLPNGNTLITEGCYGRIFEVTVEKETVWEYVYDSLDVMNKNFVYRAYRIPPEWLPINPAGYPTWEFLYT